MGVPVVVDIFVLIHPDLSRSHAVGQRFAARVGGLFREDVTHVGARVDLQAAPALPNLRHRHHHDNLVRLSDVFFFFNPLIRRLTRSLVGGKSEKPFCSLREIFLASFLRANVVTGRKTLAASLKMLGYFSDCAVLFLSKHGFRRFHVMQISPGLFSPSCMLLSLESIQED